MAGLPETNAGFGSIVAIGIRRFAAKSGHTAKSLKAVIRRCYWSRPDIRAGEALYKQTHSTDRFARLP